MLRRIRDLFNDVLRQADLLLLALCCGASLFGILMVTSATRYMHTDRYMLVQTASLLIGVVLYLVVSQIDVGELVKYWKWIFLVGVAFILLLLTPFGVEVKFVVIDWDTKTMELNSKNIDVVWNGMTLTDEVKSAMECTNAYCNNAQVVVVAK